MHYYAQLNENNICTGVSSLSNEIIQSNMIQIFILSSEYIGRKYENGEWSIEEFEI